MNVAYSIDLETHLLNMQNPEAGPDGWGGAVELMLAAGVESVNTGEHAYLVLVSKPKPVKLTTEMLQHMLANSNFERDSAQWSDECESSQVSCLKWALDAPHVIMIRSMLPVSSRDIGVCSGVQA